MKVWQMEAIDEGTDMGLFTTAHVAMENHDRELVDGYKGIWIEWPDGTWKHSFDGDVDVVVFERTVHDK